MMWNKMSDQLGKIDETLLEEFITSHCGASRKEVLVKPGFGIDVSLVELAGKQVMALTSDPLSLVPTLGLQESAWLSVQLMANDMATTGFSPQYGQFVLNLPANFSKEDFKIYWTHIHDYCEKIGMAITGGHTGFVEGQHSTIAGGGTFVSILPKDQALTSNMARCGDVILVTKTAALSSTAILAMSFPKTVREKLGKEVYLEACESFYQTSSLEEALTAVGNPGEKAVTAMHDVTEGGILGAIYELAAASGCGVSLEKNQLPVGRVQQAICNIFDLDPLKCIGAGSMIISCDKSNARRIQERILDKGIACAQVGELTEKVQGMVLRQENGTAKKLTYQKTDPYWAAFSNAFKQGWK
ncbi:AIR synthase family protein [Cyclobacterium plantarum]|nr:AIR synthase family protein [Cyclobacterium plantarum]